MWLADETWRQLGLERVVLLEPELEVLVVEVPDEEEVGGRNGVRVTPVAAPLQVEFCRLLLYRTAHHDRALGRRIVVRAGRLDRAVRVVAGDVVRVVESVEVEPRTLAMLRPKFGSVRRAVVRGHGQLVVVAELRCGDHRLHGEAGLPHRHEERDGLLDHVTVHDHLAEVHLVVVAVVDHRHDDEVRLDQPVVVQSLRWDDRVATDRLVAGHGTVDDDAVDLGAVQAELAERCPLFGAHVRACRCRSTTGRHHETEQCGHEYGYCSYAKTHVETPFLLNALIQLYAC